MPIFVALLAIRYAPSERVTGWRAIGIVLGIVGVGVLGSRPAAAGRALSARWRSSLRPSPMRSAPSTASTSWATSGLLVGTASTFWGLLAILPLGIAQRPDATPGWEAIAAVAALGLLGTAIGLLLYLYLLEQHGSAKGSLVVYLLPVTALFYGAVFLDEPIRPTAIALILAGVALGSGVVRPMRRRQAVPAPTP